MYDIFVNKIEIYVFVAACALDSLSCVACVLIVVLRRSIFHYHFFVFLFFVLITTDSMLIVGMVFPDLRLVSI